MKFNDILENSFFSFKSLFSNGKQGFKNLKLSYKIALGYSIVLGISLVGTTTGFIIGDRAQNQAQKLQEELQQEIILLDALEVNLLLTRIQQQKLIDVLQRPSRLREEYKKFHEYARETENKLSEFKSFYTELSQKAEQLEAIHTILEHESSFNSYVKQMDFLFKRAYTGDFSSEEVRENNQALFLALNRSVLVLKLEKFSQDLDDFIKSLKTEEKKVEATIYQANQLRNNIIILSILSSAVIAILVAALSVWAISRPVQNVNRVARKILNQGNLNLKIPVIAQDEIGTLGITLNSLMEQVAEYTYQLEHEIQEREKIAQKLQESQERFTLAVVGSGDGLWDWNILTDEVYFSPRFKEILGYEEDEIPNQFESWTSLLHPEDYTWVLEAIQHHINQGIPYSVEYRLCHKNEEYLWIYARGQAVWDKTGKAVRMAGSISDVTSRKRMEERLRELTSNLEKRVQERTQELSQTNTRLQDTLETLQQAQTQLIQTEKMSGLGQMVAGVAHEINNPVSFIYGNLSHAKGYTQDLLRLVELYQTQYPHPPPFVQEEIEEMDLYFVKEDFPKLLESMKAGAERIREIVNSLRNFSRLDESDLKAVDIHEGIDSTLMILNNRLKHQNKHQEIQVIKDYDQLPLIHCYSGQLNQVFMNILSNALDALEKQEEKATISIKTQKSESNWLSIKIQDNGPGIPEKFQSKLFDPFFTTKPIGKGTGLGLSISYQIIVDKHQGKLNCNSIRGEGTEFIIEIPIQ